MASHPEPSRQAWLSVLALVGLFELPTVLAPDGFDLTALRPTGEIFAALTVAAFARGRTTAVVRYGLVALVGVLAVLRVDRTVFFVLTRSEPLLYDQLFMVRHLVVLLSDLWGWQVLLGILAVLAAAALATFVARALLRRAAPLLDPGRRGYTLRVTALLWVLLLAASALGPRGTPRPWVRWMVPELVANVRESRRVFRDVQRRITSSPYGGYGRLRLARRPDVLVFFVESYGRLMAEEPSLRPIWVEALRGLEERLSSAGYHMASAYSTAPVSGGRSWMAVGSILFGTKIQYEAVMRHFLANVDHVPHLVRFFAQHGYETVLLAPVDRARPGVKAENDYGYSRYLGFNDLEYRGPRVGWGIVPDQYSLGFVEENVLARVERPLFFHFHMVSSHAPWDVVPAYVPDYRSLNRRTAVPIDGLTANEIPSRLKRYTHEVPRWNQMGELRASLREGYERSILYDFRVIEEFCERRSKDALVIFMGDHQPPVVAPENVSFDVPVHVLSRDPSVLAEFSDRGFSPGLVLPAERRAALEHTAFFSLVVRALLRASGETELPPYLAHGAVSEAAHE